jgi:hypothetical protein
MKSFISYLNESVEQSKYVFLIKIAGEIPDHCEDAMKQAIEKYKVSKFEKLRTTPIQATLPDFPQIENAEVTIFKIELDYPTTSVVLHSCISENTGINSANIKVRSEKEEAEAELNSENCDKDSSSKPLLLSPYEKTKDPQLHGEKYISKFLKDLQKTSLEQYKGVNDQILAKKSPTEKNQG